MYYMENGVRQDVVQAYDEISQEYGYVIICSECQSVDFMPECKFLDFVDECEIDLVVECEIDLDAIEDDEDLCQCDYCKGFRDGIERACDVRDALEERECECGECCDICEPDEFDDDDEIINGMIREDIQSMLLALKREIDNSTLRSIDSRSELVNMYEKLYNLIY